jgi:hypothetical protein
MHEEGARAHGDGEPAPAGEGSKDIDRCSRGVRTRDTSQSIALAECARARAC